MAYLSFDDRQGNRYPNAADRAKDANTNGNNKEVEGKFGKGIHFSGDDALNFPSGVGDFIPCPDSFLAGKCHPYSIQK